MNAPSKIAGRERVEIDKRLSMSPARKLRIWEAHLGRCEECGTQLPVSGPTVAYDHVIALKLGGKDEDVNVQPLCTVPCHAKKTAHDLALIAQAKRRSGETGQNVKRREIPSRPFDRNLTRKFDGVTRPRKLRISGDEA